ncbi:MAG: AAA family ATPase [Candidatus Gracilibacteria bacterium]|nr:AAA family ATPase [Candidatus Gracilibacteria bacterium]
MEITEKIKQVSQKLDSVKTQMNKRIIGQEQLIRNLLIGLLTKGHILLEGAPGLAKTLTIETLSKTLHLDFRRIQFTPDLLPSDLIGAQIFNQKEGDFMTKKGPIFANFILADEINRAPSKVQSALLEAMQEKQVTIGEKSYELDTPFLVLATQNPLEQEGTFPLPEAQLDRFLFKTQVFYPREEEEIEIMKTYANNGLEEIEKTLSKTDISEMQNLLNDIFVDENIYIYIRDIVFATRKPREHGLMDLAKYIEYGASPRASLAFIKASKALALMNGRHFVIPEDIKEISKDILRHRIGLSYEAIADDVHIDDVIEKIIDSISVK